VSAVFSRIKHTVAVTKVGAGKVISSPSGIDCGPTCSGVFNQGDPLTLTATPDDGREFVGWSGSCTGSNPVCSLTISVAIATVATFRDVPIRLTVTRTGDGSVTSQPAGISCGSTCGFDFLKNSTVTLTAAPASGAFFAGWGGACSGGALTCTVKLDAAKTATAAFRTPALTLSALAFNVRWSRSQATGSLDVAGTTTDGAEILVTLATAAPLPLTLSSGAFKISVPMPAGLLPGPQHVVITAVSHGINLPPTDRQVVLKGPPEGVVSEVTFSSTENGPPVDKYPQGAKELFARFRFAAPPQRVCKQKRIRNKKTKKVRVKRVCTARQITVTWFRPNGEAAGAPVKKAFSAVVTTFVRSNVVLPSGRWRVELRAGRVLVRDAEVVVG
jgi:hypothetical protein